MDNTIKSWNKTEDHASGGIFYPNVTNFPSMLMGWFRDLYTGTWASGSVWNDVIGARTLTAGGTVASDTDGLAASVWTFGGTLPVWPASSKLLFVVTGKATGPTNAWLIGGSPTSGGDAGIRIVRSSSGATQAAVSLDNTGLNYHDHAALSATPGVSIPSCCLMQLDISGNAGKRVVADNLGVVGLSTNTVTSGSIAGMTSASITTNNFQPTTVSTARNRSMALYNLATALTDDELKRLALFNALYPQRVCPILYKRLAAT